MGRKLVAVDVTINGELLRIGTVHLESLPPGRKKRVIQLEESMEVCCIWIYDKIIYIISTLQSSRLDVQSIT